MNILEKIAQSKREEVQAKKELLPLEVLEILPHYNRHCLSLKENLLKDPTGIIAEFKRRSPSLPGLNLDADVEEVSSGYESAGASGISVLTDEVFFRGTLEDLEAVSSLGRISTPPTCMRSRARWTTSSSTRLRGISITLPCAARRIRKRRKAPG